MSPEPRYPGVYIEEIPSCVHTITGVGTSIAIFVGRTASGSTDPALVRSFADYERHFGGLTPASPMSCAVRDFFLNGGNHALIIRVASSTTVFVGRAPRGPINQPVLIHSFADYERQFGEHAAANPMSNAVRDFYLNGGSYALVTRVTLDEANLAGIGEFAPQLPARLRGRAPCGGRSSARGAPHETRISPHGRWIRRRYDPAMILGYLRRFTKSGAGPPRRAPSRQRADLSIGQDIINTQFLSDRLKTGQL